MRKVVTLLVENEAGTLARIVGLFSQRGYNIETLNVAPTQDSTLSCITLTTRTDDVGMEQVVKQLNKVVNVVTVIPYNNTQHLSRELALVKILAGEENRADILSIAQTFQAHIVDSSPHSYIFQVTGTHDHIKKFLDKIGVFSVREIRCSGELILSRGISGINENKDLKDSEGN